jgi:tetratricopeptide (TPR) repeat protein
MKYILFIRNLFELCYNDPANADKLEGQKGWANFVVMTAINREELDAKLLKEGKSIYQNPDFKQLSVAIEKKYPKLDLKQSLLDYQISYYRSQNQWKLWAKCIDEILLAHPLVFDGGLNVYGGLNIPAWDAFLNCPDKSVLKTALKWSDLSIKLEHPNPRVQYLDTRAQLLYKLGRVYEAINQEKEAVQKSKDMAKQSGTTLGSFLNEYMVTLEKMKQHVQTW